MNIVMVEMYGMLGIINGNVVEFLGCNWIVISDIMIVFEDK